MKLPFGAPIIEKEERDAVAKVLDGPILVHGPKALEFENSFKKFTKAPYAISVSSCTAGMHLIYFTLGLGPGDEVIVPAQTHIATAHAVELTGAKPVFVDAIAETGNIDINRIESAITKKTRAISIVHYLGVPVDMISVKKITTKHKIFLLEDCALAPGAFLDGVHVGLHGDAGVFSFYPVKHLTTAEGGMIILKDAKLADKLRIKKAFGVDRNFGERKIPGIYETVTLGFNYRMSEIHAAIGIEQMKKLPFFLQKRRKNFKLMESILQREKSFKIIPQPYNKSKISSYYCLSLILDNELAKKRPDIMKELTSRGIGSSIYYPQPVPRMKYYRDKYGYNDSEFLNSAIISDNSIALPVGPHLNEENIKTIAETLINIIKTI
tara:strand:+ start:144 stop:1286 length:1143 start_codon:yes stop_codon:yes gene_type:complete